jgi:hypothetical protein
MDGLNFALNVAASIVAGVLLLVFTGWLSDRARWVLTATLGRLLNIDVEYVFRNSQHADEDIKRELQRASSISLLSGRGNELQRGTFAVVLQPSVGQTERKLRILLPAVRVQAGEKEWTVEREREIASFDHAFGSGVLRQQIETTTKFLEQHVKAKHLELRFFNAPHLGRVLLTEHYAFLTLYRKNAHGRDCRVTKYRRGGDMYDALERLFEQLWAA